MRTKNLKLVLASQAVEPTSAKTIAKVGFGEGDVAATVDDEGLTNPYIKGITSYKVNADYSITITYNLGYTEANGKKIREVGLYCQDGTTLVAREVRDTVEKDADTAIEGSMTVVL